MCLTQEKHQTRHRKTRSPIGSDNSERATFQPVLLFPVCSALVSDARCEKCSQFLPGRDSVNSRPTVQKQHYATGLFSKTSDLGKPMHWTRLTTLRGWAVQHLSSLSRSPFHFISSRILCVSFSFFKTLPTHAWAQPLNAPCCLETLLQKTNINHRLCLAAWPPISAAKEHNPAGCHLKSYERKFEGMSWFDIHQNHGTHPSISQLQFLETLPITLPLTCTSPWFR